MIDLINRVCITTWTRLRREEGQTMVEYGLILALVAVVAVVSLGVIGTNVNGVFDWVSGKISHP